MRRGSPSGRKLPREGHYFPYRRGGGRASAKPTLLDNLVVSLMRNRWRAIRRRTQSPTSSIGIRPNLSQGGQRYPKMLGDLGWLDPGHQRRSDRVALGLGHLAIL